MASEGGVSRQDAIIARVLLAAALIATAGVYSRSIRGEFQFDDEANVERNLQVKNPERLFALQAWSLAERPLTTLTLALNHRADRLDPTGYHVVNVAIHLATVVLVFLLSRRALRTAGLTSPERCAAAVAGLFALHPLQTESVSYIVQRAESLASLLYVSTLLLLLETETAATRRRSALAYAGALVAGLAALAAKQIAATLPVAFVLYAHCFPPAATAKSRIGRRIALTAPFFGLSALAAWQALRATSGSTHAGMDVPGLGIQDYVLTELRVAFRYVELLAWPSGQNVDPDIPVSRSFLEPETIVAAIGFATMTIGSLVLIWRGGLSPPGRRRFAVAAFGLLWFVLQLLPSSLVPLADVMAEHRVYLASWGLFLAVVAVVEGAADVFHVAPAARVAALLALWGALAGTTWARNGLWASRVALWSDAAAKSPGKARPHASLGWAYARQGDHERAVAAYRMALERNPDRHHEAEYLRNMGSSLAQLGRHGEAASVLAAAATEPCVEADARSLHAMSLIELRLFDAAREEVTRALRIDPDHGAARNTLGQILLAENDPAAALEQFRIAVSLDPDVPPRRFNVALALERLGRTAESCAAWKEYLRLEQGQAAIAKALPHLEMLGCGFP